MNLISLGCVMGQIVRSITHWTAGTGKAGPKDKKHYHKITEYDGTVVLGNEAIEDNIVTADGDYAAHTLNMNGGSGGFAMAGMHDAKENPFNPGKYPINEVQFEAHCKMLAGFHAEYGILPILPENCLTHAEVEGTLGVKQRGKWDLTRLPFKPELVGAKAVGDYMRERVRFYLGAMPEQPVMQRPVLAQGHAGLFVKDAQGLLATKGFFSGKQDGIFGPRTKAAVQAFQGNCGLLPDGIIGPQTWTALMSVEPMPERDVSLTDLREAGSQTVKEADKGQAVATVGAVVAGASGVLETVTGTTETLTQAESALEVAQRIAVTYWPVLVALLGCAALWWMFENIKKRRVADARSGRNLGR